MPLRETEWGDSEVVSKGSWNIINEKKGDRELEKRI